MRVKVIFPPLHEDNRPPRRDDRQAIEYEWDAPGPTEAEALSQTFREFNAVEEGDAHWCRECRSLSVGDVVEINGRCLVCDMAGWTPMTKQEAAVWMLIPFRMRIMGPSFRPSPKGAKR